MVDTVAIMFSTLACIFMIIRAIRLDRELPWFLPPTPAPTAPAETKDPVAWTPDWQTDDLPDAHARRD